MPRSRAPRPLLACASVSPAAPHTLTRARACASSVPPGAGRRARHPRTRRRHPRLLPRTTELPGWHPRRAQRPHTARRPRTAPRRWHTCVHACAPAAPKGPQCRGAGGCPGTARLGTRGARRRGARGRGDSAALSPRVTAGGWHGEGWGARHLGPMWGRGWGQEGGTTGRGRRGCPWGCRDMGDWGPQPWGAGDVGNRVTRGMGKWDTGCTARGWEGREQGVHGHAAGKQHGDNRGMGTAQGKGRDASHRQGAGAGGGVQEVGAGCRMQGAGCGKQRHGAGRRAQVIKGARCTVHGAGCGMRMQDAGCRTRRTHRTRRTRGAGHAGHAGHAGTCRGGWGSW